jgi:two-component system response regulator PilR (NtrC family)
MKPRILYISPSSEDAERLALMIQPLGLALIHAATLRNAVARLRDRKFSLILTEATLPDGDWLDVLEFVQQKMPSLKVMVTDPLADTRLWAEALNRGAYDLLVQPFDEPEVQRILSYACFHGVNGELMRTAV